MKRAELKTGQVVVWRRGKWDSPRVAIVMDTQPWENGWGGRAYGDPHPTRKGNGVAIATGMSISPRRLKGVDLDTQLLTGAEPPMFNREEAPVWGRAVVPLGQLTVEDPIAVARRRIAEQEAKDKASDERTAQLEDEDNRIANINRVLPDLKLQRDSRYAITVDLDGLEALLRGHGYIG